MVSRAELLAYQQGTVLFLFVLFKMTGVLTWSWWWVLSPLWLPFAVVGVITGLGLLLRLAAWTVGRT